MCTTSVPPPRASSTWPPATPTPRSPHRPRGAGRLLHLHRLRPLHRRVPVRGRPYRTPEDVRLLTYEIALYLARQQVRYAELTITPFSSTRRGIDELAFMEAIEDARKAAEAEFGTVLRWCFDIPGEAGLVSAEETVGMATDERLCRKGLVSFGLGGPQRAYPGRSSSRISTRRSRPVSTPFRTPGRYYRPGDGVGRGHPPARRAHRTRHQLREGREAPRPSRRTPDRAGGVPDLQHRHARGAHARRAPPHGLRRRPARRSRSTPTTC
ncbi:hypothetical protein SALBM311S_00490 [Streptomyces alboniger]